MSKITSRLMLLDAPIMSPGVCTLCGSSGDGTRKFIDFGKQLDWYGTIYLCSECIREASEICDYIPVAKFNELHNEFKTLQIELDRLKRNYGVVSNALVELLSNNSSEPIDVDDVIRRNIFAKEEPGSMDAIVRDAAEGNTEANESSNVEGSDDLYDATDFE